MIGSKIKELRAKKQITQEELGKIVGVTTSMIGMYEIDARKPSYDVMKKLADYFNVPVDYLLGRDDNSGEILSASPDIRMIARAGLSDKQTAVLLEAAKVMFPNAFKNKKDSK